MRVLRLDLDRRMIEFHPYVTVVRGCTPSTREQLLQVLADLPNGKAAVGGLVEAHGVMLDLGAASLGLLDLDVDLDVVVGAKDLPNTRGDEETPEIAAARRQVADAQAVLRAAETGLVAAVTRRDRAQEALERAADRPTEPTPVSPSHAGAGAGAVELADAEAAVARASARAERARDALEEAERTAAVATSARREAAHALAAAEAALDGAGGGRDPIAAKVLDAARRRLVDAEAALVSLRSGAAASEQFAGSPPDEIHTQRALLAATLTSLETTDPLPVRLALQQLESGSNGMVASPEALELAERWAILTIDLDRHGVIAEDDDQVDAVERSVQARHRLVVAQSNLARVEAIMHGPILDPGDVADVEAAHEEVSIAREAVDKRFGGAKHSQRLDEAVLAEHEILARLGFLSWSDYRLGLPAYAVVSEEELARQHGAASDELAEAREECRVLEAGIEAELIKAEVLDRRRRLRAASMALLGTDPGGDVEGALRRHRVSAEMTGGHLGRLRKALDGAGIALTDEDIDERILSDLANVWLQEQADTEHHRQRIQAELAVLDVQLAELETVEGSPVDAEPLVAAARAVEAAQTAVALAEARSTADDAAASEIEGLRAAYQAASAADRLAIGSASFADEQVVAAAALVRAAVDEVDRRKRMLTAAGAASAADQEAAAERERRLAEVATQGIGPLEEELDDAAAAVDDAKAELADRGRAVGDALGALASAEQAAWVANAADRELSMVSEPQDVEDVEWYLLARLAAQRSVSYAGSVPLVLDDALAGLDTESMRRVLERLERMAATVQVVLVTEDLSTAAWAEAVGRERAVVSEV